MKSSDRTAKSSPTQLTPAQMRKRLAQNSPQYVEHPQGGYGSASAPRPAAVLIPMLSIDHRWHLLFIRRAENGNDHHSGQVAFPGGRREPGDIDLQATALRETFEEIGIAPQDIDVVGRLGDFVSTTNYRIAPFVGIVPSPYRLRLAPDEVAHTFTIPLIWLSDPSHREMVEHPLPSGKIPVIRYRPYDGEVLWGATARMTVSLVHTLADESDSLAADRRIMSEAQIDRRARAG